MEKQNETNDISPAPPLEPWQECRKAFIRMIKDENFESGYFQSVKQHWMGPKEGFSDHMVQRRWLDFKAGWNAMERQQQKKN